MNEARRIRSPNYPALSLAEAIQRIKPVFERERLHPMPREVVLKGLGYAGPNGAALGTLSAVGKYGLLEKSGDSYRVSSRAVAILHPSSPEEELEALRAAALEPPLFAELVQQFPGGQVSDDNLRSFLVRQGFSSGALSGVIQAFRETMQMVSLPGESPGAPRLPAPSISTPPATRPLPMQWQQPAASPPVSPWVLSTNTEGGFIDIAARLDNAEAVDRLIRFLEAGKQLLVAKTPDAVVQKGTDEAQGPA